MERRLAVGMRGENGGAVLIAQLNVVVDLGVGDQRRATRLVKRLIACLQVDDGETAVDHHHIANAIVADAIGATVGEGRAHGLHLRLIRRRAIPAHQPGDAAHYVVPLTIASKKPR